MRHEAELCKSYLEHGLLDLILSVSQLHLEDVSKHFCVASKTYQSWKLLSYPKCSCFWKIYQHLSKSLPIVGKYTRHEAYGYGANCFTSRSNQCSRIQDIQGGRRLQEALEMRPQGGEHQKYWKLSGTVKKDGKVANIMRSCWFHHIVGEIHQVLD